MMIARLSARLLLSRGCQRQRWVPSAARAPRCSCSAGRTTSTCDNTGKNRHTEQREQRRVQAPHCWRRLHHDGRRAQALHLRLRRRHRQAGGPDHARLAGGELRGAHHRAQGGPRLLPDADQRRDGDAARPVRPAHGALPRLPAAAAGVRRHARGLVRRQHGLDGHVLLQAQRPRHLHVPLPPGGTEHMQMGMLGNLT